jgi:AcrR family transcriptional regulator
VYTVRYANHSKRYKIYLSMGCAGAHLFEINPGDSGTDDMIDRRKRGDTPRTTSRRMSANSDRSNFKQRQIFDALAKVVIKTSGGGINMDTISASMGSSKGSLYYYFQSKGEMLYKMNIYAFDLLDEAFADILADQSLSDEERLRRVIRAQILTICDHWQLWRATWTDPMIREASIELVRLLNRRRKKYEKIVTGVILPVLETRANRTIDTKMAVRTIISMVNGVSRWYRKNGPLTPEEISENMCTFILDGFLKRAA